VFLSFFFALKAKLQVLNKLRVLSDKLWKNHDKLLKFNLSLLLEYGHKTVHLHSQTSLAPPGFFRYIIIYHGYLKQDQMNNIPS